MPIERVVCKFGGTSVSSRPRWGTIAAVVRGHLAEGRVPIVVCSAISGVSNLLERLLPHAVAGRHAPVLAELRAKHVALAAELGLPVDIVEGELADVERVASGVALLGEFTPRMRARVMATGELMLTRLGAAWLAAEGIGASWIDARSLLLASQGANDARHYLSATCDYARDSTLDGRLGPGPVVTQGFIARDARGDTVLLGRGGSDTSAAYLAAKIGASRLEIWTDVPGMYTADPRLVPHARLLRRLDYAEAQELAATGAKVLHPRSIAPARDAGIPLWIKSTPDPEVTGTVIVATEASSARVRAVASRNGILLLSMETVGMWQEVGFLARAFAVLERHGLSIDLVATSESNVTVSLDALANALDPAVLDAAVAELRQLCEVRVIGPCAAVSLVGHRIRAILHELGPALEAFAEHRIHLVSQAASDLNLTFVVDEDQAARLVVALHRRCLEGGDDPDLGPAWREPEAAWPRWWTERRDELLAIAGEGTPAYVTNLAIVRGQMRQLAAVGADRVFYAMKANPLVAVLRAVASEGGGIECVSAGELSLAAAVVPGERILFTPNFAAREEYAQARQIGAVTTVDGAHPLVAWPELFAGREIHLRVDPGAGRGHHRHVRTAGATSKFGVLPSELPSLLAAAASAGARVVGLHAHVGSGITEPGAWAEVATTLLALAETCPDLRRIDVGGGLGVPYRPGERALDPRAVGEALAPLRRAAPGLEIWIEPGRYVVAEAGALLARVTQVKRKGDRCFVGIDAGMNALLRPALYGAWHPVVNLSRPGAPLAIVADVVGPICETGDVIAASRALPECKEGDVLLVGLAGAYGLAMASTYNSRPLPRTLCLDEAGRDPA